MYILSAYLNKLDIRRQNKFLLADKFHPVEINLDTQGQEKKLFYK